MFGNNCKTLFALQLIYAELQIALWYKFFGFKMRKMLKTMFALIYRCSQFFPQFHKWLLGKIYGRRSQTNFVFVEARFEDAEKTLVRWKFQHKMLEAY